MTRTVAPPFEPAVPTTAMACAGALLATAAIVGVGQTTAVVVAEALGHWMVGTNVLFTRLSGTLLVGVYQLALLWLLVRWLSGDGLRDALGLNWPNLRAWHWLAILLGLYALKAAASIAILWLTQIGSPPVVTGKAGGGGITVAGLAPFAAIMRSPAWPLLLAGGIMAAIVEELLYRGYLSRTLEGSSLGFWGGALLASVVWAGLHLYYPLGLQAMLVIVGLALSWLRARTGSVYPGMAWHILNNTVGLVAMRLLT